MRKAVKAQRRTPHQKGGGRQEGFLEQAVISLNYTEKVIPYPARAGHSLRKAGRRWGRGGGAKTKHRAYSGNLSIS